MLGSGRLALAYGAVLLAIIAIDRVLGSTAEYLNAWEIVRQTLPGSRSAPSLRFVMCQDALGRAALPVAWLAFCIEGAVVTGLLRVLWGCVAR